MGDGDILVNVFVSVTSLIEDVLGFFVVRSDGPERITGETIPRAWSSEYDHAALVRLPAVVYLRGDGIGGGSLIASGQARRTTSWILSLTYCKPHSRFVISMVTIPSPDGTSTVLVLDMDGDRSMTNTVAVY